MSDQPQPAGEQIRVGNITGSTAVAIGAGAQATTIIQQAPAAPALRQLRAPVGDFVGRAAELAELAGALRASGGQAAIGGLRGMGGVGKTELALRVAHELAADYPDAQLLLALGGAGPAPLSQAQALQAAIRAFEPERRLPEDAAELQQIYAGLLSGRRALILADDALDAAQARALMPPPGCALIVTSRPRFSLPAMHTLDLGALPPEEAAALLLAVCPRIGDAAAELAALCGHLPLALRVSASLLRDNPARDVARYLEQLRDERLGHLEDPEGDPDDPQASVQASIALSFVALPPEAQAALAQLSVFAGSFDQPAALAVLAGVGGEAGDEEQLELLLRRSLLEYDEGRYALNELVRTFAAAHLPDADAAAAQLGHARHYLAVAVRAESELYLKGEALAGLALFDRERPQIDATWAWALAHAGEPQADELLLSLADATVNIGDLRYDLRRDRIPQLEAHIAAARRLGRRNEEGNAIGNLGMTYVTLGDYQRALDYLAQDLAIMREVNDRRGESASLVNHGNVYLALGDTQQAIGFYEQCLAIAREVQDRRGEGAALGNLGSASGALGDVPQAISYYEQSLAIAQEVGDRVLESNVLLSLGYAASTQGETQRAVGFYEQGLTIAHEMQNQRGELSALVNLGIAHVTLGDVRRGIGCFEQALAIAGVVEDRPMELSALGAMAEAYVALGDTQQAVGAYERQLSIARELGDRNAEAYTSWNFGLALERQGELERAAALMQACVAIEREAGHPDAEKDAQYVEQLRQRIAAGQGGA